MNVQVTTRRAAADDHDTELAPASGWVALTDRTQRVQNAITTGGGENSTYSSGVHRSSVSSSWIAISRRSVRHRENPAQLRRRHPQRGPQPKYGDAQLPPLGQFVGRDLVDTEAAGGLTSPTVRVSGVHQTPPCGITTLRSMYSARALREYRIRPLGRRT